MPKINYVNKQKNITEPLPNWQETVRANQENVMSLPQVVNGHVSPNKAMNWLESVAKMQSPSIVKRLVEQTKGFTTDEIRALVAHDGGEYYEKFAASEVYALKNLEAFKTPDIDDRKKHVLNKLFFEVATHKYDISAVSQQDIATYTTGRRHDIPWLQNESRRLVKHPNAVPDKSPLMLVDLKINYNMDLTQSDVIRHHYGHMALASQGIYCDKSFQFNIKIDPDWLDLLYAQAKMGPDAFKHVRSLLIEQEKRGDLKIENEPIDLSKEIYSKIKDAGTTHHYNITNGIAPEFKATEKQTLTPQEQATYTEYGKRYAVAKKLLDIAKVNYEEVKTELPQFVLGLNKGLNFDSPYPLVIVGDNKPFDYDSAIHTLQQQRVHPAHYTKTEYAIDDLVKAAQAKGIDTSKYQKQGDPIKSKVVECVESLGFKQEDFKASGYHTHFHGDSRGEISVQKKAITEAVMSEAQKLQNTLLDSPILEQQDKTADQQNRSKPSMGA